MSLFSFAGIDLLKLPSSGMKRFMGLFSTCISTAAPASALAISSWQRFSPVPGIDSFALLSLGHQEPLLPPPLAACEASDS
jgi:hypothetical protein